MRTAKRGGRVVRRRGVLVVFAFVFSGIAEAAQWVDLEATDLRTGARYFVDRSSTTFDGDLMYVRVKRELKARYGPPEGERSFSPCVDPPIVCANAGTSIHNFAVHCASRSTAETGITRYDLQGQPTSSQTVPRSQWEFAQAAPDTLADRIVSLACPARKAPSTPKIKRKDTLS